MSLATLLTETASAHGDRPALKLDDTVVNYAFLNQGATRDRRPAARKRAWAGRSGRDHAAERPVLPDRLLRHPARGRRRRADERAAQGARGRVLSQGLGRQLLFAWHDFGEAATPGAEEAGTEAILVKPGEFEQLVMDAPRAEEDEPRDGEDTAVILYTSGTTGTPKGAELTHGNLRAELHGDGATLVGIKGPDVILGALPLFHSFGQTCGMNTAVATGACLTLIPRFDPRKALEMIERDKVTVLQGVPTMYHAMLNAPEPRGRRHVVPAGVRVGRLGDAGRGHGAFEKAFDCMILEGYGLSETSPVASFNHPDRDRKPGSIGTPIEGVEMKLVDDDGNEVAAGRGGRDRHPRPQRHERLLEPRRTRPRRPCAAAGSTPATWRRSTRTATTSSSIARRT